MPWAMKQGWRPLQLLDSAMPGLAAGLVVGRLGDLMIGDHIGAPTNFVLGWRCTGDFNAVSSLWGRDPGSYTAAVQAIGDQPTIGCFDTAVHQTALYDLGAALFVLLLLLWLERRPRFDGFFAAAWVYGYGVVRFAGDFARQDRRLLGLTGSQYALLAAMVAVTVWLVRRRPWERTPVGVGPRVRPPLAASPRTKTRTTTRTRLPTARGPTSWPGPNRDVTATDSACRPRRILGTMSDASDHDERWDELALGHVLGGLARRRRQRLPRAPRRLRPVPCTGRRAAVDGLRPRRRRTRGTGDPAPAHPDRAAPRTVHVPPPATWTPSRPAAAPAASWRPRSSRWSCSCCRCGPPTCATRTPSCARSPTPMRAPSASRLRHVGARHDLRRRDRRGRRRRRRRRLLPGRAARPRRERAPGRVDRAGRRARGRRHPHAATSCGRSTVASRRPSARSTPRGC